MSMAFNVRWCRDADAQVAPWTNSEDELTLAELELRLAGEALTRAEDTLSGEVREYAVLPAGRLAEWFVWNWWRLRWEPRRGGKTSSLDWLTAHHMSAAGNGWLWPNVEFRSDGVRMIVQARPSVRAASQPLRYLSQASVVLPGGLYESAIDHFVECVCERLRCAAGQSPLEQTWKALREERADSDLAFYRRLEALLGHDVDEGPAELIERLLLDVPILGHEAVAELAANSDHKLSAHWLRERARAVGVDSRVGDRVGQFALQSEANMPAWRIGVAAARGLRSQEKLGMGVVVDGRLAQLLAVPDTLLSDERRTPELAYELADQSGLRRLVLRSKWHTGRRFELARLLGDYLLGPSESLHPATQQDTFRQKKQRAFAAEFLCPLEALQDFLSDDFSDEAQQGAAEHFQVSPVTVSTQLVNNGLIGRESLFESDPDIVAA